MVPYTVNVFATLKKRLSFKRPASGVDAPGRPWWWWVVGGAFGFYGLYVIAATVFLCLGGLTWATQAEKDVRLDVTSGYSLFPGRVHVSGLRVQFKDYNVAMLISADEADISIALHRLPLKNVHVRWARASGVEYKLLHRVQDPKKSAARLAAFPDIPAFDRPAYYDAPRPPRSNKQPWQVRFDSINADVRFAWIMEYQVRGKMIAQGAFYTDPAHEAEVLPCDVQLSAATISVGNTQIAHDVHGSLSFALAPFTVRDAPFAEVITKISAGIEDFSGELDTLSFSQMYLPSARFSFEGKGQLKVDTTVAKGQIQSSSRASLSLAPLTVVPPSDGKDSKLTFTPGGGEFSLLAGPNGHLDVTALLHVPPKEGAALSVEKFDVRAGLEHPDITQIKATSLQLDMRSLHFQRPEFLYSMLGRSVAVPMSGTFHAQAEADLPEGGPGRLDADLEMLSTSFYFEGQRAGATAEAKLGCQGTRKEADCTIDFHAPYLRFDKQSDGTGEALWLRLKTQQSTRVSAEDGTFDGDFLISGGDPHDMISEWLGEAWLKQLGLKLVPTGTINGSFKAKRTEQELSFSEVDIASGKSRLEGSLTSGKTITALGTIKMPTGRWGFEINPEGVRVRPLVGRNWINKQ